MENSDTTYPEILWERLLSRQAEQVQAAFASLNTAEQRSALEHLQRMASEPGWHPEQRASALAALHVLQAPTNESR